MSDNLTINRKFAVKKEMKYTLKECLGDLTKTRLGDLASIYEVSGRSKMGKDELVENLMVCINNDELLEDFKKQLSAGDVALLENLYNNDFVDVSSEKMINFIHFLRVGLAYLYATKDEVLLTMPKDVKENFKDYNFKGERKEAERVDLIDKYIEVFSFVYGIFETDFLVDVFNSHYEDKLSKEELLNALELFKMKNGTIEFDEDRVINECVFEYEDGVTVLEEVRKGKDYYMLDKYEILLNSDIDNFFITSAHQNLKEFLINLCKDDEAAHELFYSISFDLRNDGVGPEDILEEISARKLPIKNKNDIKILMKLVLNVSNVTRKWANKGYTPYEVQELNLERLASKKQAGRNEPCPCGSGKKYKKCCGK